jgi:hypothetical protein
MSDNKDTKVKNSRPPGRPKKNQNNNDIKKYGITAQATDPKMFLECTLAHPMYFKKMSTMFTSNSRFDTVFMEFNRENLIIKFKDATMNDRGRIEYDAKQMVRYYVEQPYKIKIKSSHFKCVNKIKKDSYSTISFIINRDCKQKLNVCLENTNAGGLNNNNQLDTILSSDEQFPSDSEYKHAQKHDFGFKIDAKAFKDIVSDKKTIENHLIIDYSSDSGITRSVMYTKGEKGAIISEFPTTNIIEYISDRKEVERKKLIGISVQLKALRKVPTALSFKDENTKKENKLFFKISDILPLHISAVIGEGAIFFDYIIPPIDYNSKLNIGDVTNGLPSIDNNQPIIDTKQDIKQDMSTKQDKHNEKQVQIAATSESVSTFDLDEIVNQYQKLTHEERADIAEKEKQKESEKEKDILDLL